MRQRPSRDARSLGRPRRQWDRQQASAVALADQQDAVRLATRVRRGDVAVCDHLNDLRCGYSVAGHLGEIVLIEDERRDTLLRHPLIVIEGADGADGAHGGASVSADPLPLSPCRAMRLRIQPRSGLLLFVPCGRAGHDRRRARSRWNAQVAGCPFDAPHRAFHRAGLNGHPPITQPRSRSCGHRVSRSRFGLRGTTDRGAYSFGIGNSRSGLPPSIAPARYRGDWI